MKTKEIVKNIKPLKSCFENISLYHIAEIYGATLSISQYVEYGVYFSDTCKIEIEKYRCGYNDLKDTIIMFCHELGHHLQNIYGCNDNFKNKDSFWPALNYERQADMLGYVLYKKHFSNLVKLQIKDFSSYLDNYIWYQFMEFYGCTSKHIENYYEMLDAIGNQW